MCSTDMQCADAGANGRCILNYGGVATCFCTHDSCDGDTGCAKGETCACHGSAYSRAEGNRCVPSNCRVDSDCGACGWCSPSPSTMACGPVTGYYCHTAQDQCVNDSDCADAGGIGACVFDTSAGHWRCNMELLCQ